MPKKLTQARLCRETLAAAREFCDLEPWEFFEPDDFFVLRTPESDEPLLGSVMGQSGLERGLLLLRGSEAREQMWDILTRGGKSAMGEARMVGFSLTRLAEIDPRERSFLKKAGFHGRRESLVPFFVVTEPGAGPRGMRADEAREMLYVLRGLLKAIETGQLDLADFETAEPTIEIEGDPTDPDVAVGLTYLEDDDEEWDDGEDEDVEEGDDGEDDEEWDDAEDEDDEDGDYGEDDEEGEGAVIARFAPTEEDDGAEDDQAWLLSLSALDDTGGSPGGWGAGLMDLDSQELCGMTHLGELTPETLVPWVQGVLAAAPRGQEPRVLLVGHRDAADWLRPALAARGVRCEFDEAVALAQGLADEFAPIHEAEDVTPIAVLFGDSPVRRDEVASIVAQLDDVWALVIGEMSDLDLPSERGVKRYFGDAKVARELLDAHPPERSLAWACLDNWLCFHYRATKRSKTIAERLIERGLRKEDEELVRALADAPPTVWRVEEKREDVAVLRDVFSAEAAPISATLGPVPWRPGMAWLGKAVPWRECRLVLPLGPVLPPDEVVPALKRLAEMGATLTHEGLARDCHLLGRLWDWSPGPYEGVSDIGDHGWRDEAPVAALPLAVERQSGVLDDLRSQPDIVEDVDGTLLWIRPSESGQLFDNPDVRGLITWGRGALFLEARTAEDLLEGRVWLKELAEA